MLVIDSGEKQYFFNILDKLNLRYKIEEIKFWYCVECERIFSEAGECPDCEIELLSEKAGDITNERRSFVIERKRDSNLYSSVHNGEIYDQLNRLQKYFKGNVAIVFEGSLRKLAEENPDRAAQILSIPATCLQYGVSFINFDNELTTGKMLKYFDYKSGKEPKLRHKRRVIYKKLPEMVNLLMGIKGIGKKTAYDIYLKCKNMYTLALKLKHKTEEIEEIKGIGKATLSLLKKWIL